jgi:hypothetical protein
MRNDYTITHLYMCCHLLGCFWSQRSSRCETTRNAKTNTDCLINYFSTKAMQWAYYLLQNQASRELRHALSSCCTNMVVSDESEQRNQMCERWLNHQQLTTVKSTDRHRPLCHVDDHNYWRRKLIYHASVWWLRLLGSGMMQCILWFI